MKMLRICVLFALALAGAATSLADEAEFVAPADWGEGWYARIDTSKGRIVARLLPDQAPQSVAHFAAMAEGRLPWTDPVTGEEHRGRYYDGVQVHKAVAGERFEAGDRTGTGHGAPLMYVPQEGAGPRNFYEPFRLGMTRSSLGRISAVQFFVTVSSQPWLSPRHPCFGEVVSGREVAWSICEVKTYDSGRPIEPVVIEAIRIFKIGDPRALPEPRPYQPVTPQMELREGLDPHRTYPPN